MKVSLKKDSLVADTQTVGDELSTREIARCTIELEPGPDERWVACFYNPSTFSSSPYVKEYEISGNLISFRCITSDREKYLEGLKDYVSQANEASEKQEAERRQKRAAEEAAEKEKRRRDAELGDEMKKLL